MKRMQIVMTDDMLIRVLRRQTAVLKVMDDPALGPGFHTIEIVHVDALKGAKPDGQG